MTFWHKHNRVCPFPNKFSYFSISDSPCVTRWPEIIPSVPEKPFIETEIESCKHITICYS